MNETIRLIREVASRQLPPLYNTGVDPDNDEKAVRDLLLKMEYGKNDWKVTSDWNKFERWDIQGTDEYGVTNRFEVKSRPTAKGEKWPTWIIDVYKVDYMMDNFGHEPNYFVNACDGRFEVYDMEYIKYHCDIRNNVPSWINGKKELRDFYYIPKDMFMIELVTGELGKGSELNQTFVNEQI